METSMKNNIEGKNDIRQSRMKALSKGYQNPSLAGYSFDSNVSGDCSDMCSGACNSQHKNNCSVHYPA